MRQHFIPTRMTTIKNKEKITSVGEDTEKWEPSGITGGNVK